VGLFEYYAETSWSPMHTATLSAHTCLSRGNLIPIHLESHQSDSSDYDWKIEFLVTRRNRCYGFTRTKFTFCDWWKL